MKPLDILRGRCPRCRRGPIFKPGLPGLVGIMNDACPVCGLTFLREAGYFLGAMYVSYGLGIFIVLPVSVFLAIVVKWPLPVVLAEMFLQTLLSMPVFFRLSRVIWLYFDQAIDPA